VAFWATGTAACQPLTPSVVLPLRGTPGLSPPPPRQRTALLPDQSAWPRYLALSACFRMPEGCRAPTPAISTIHEHDRDLPNPAPQLPRLPPRDALPGGLAPFGARPAEPLGIRGPQRVSSRRAPPAAIARLEVGYPDPHGSDTFCRRRVARTAGGAALARCAMRAPVTCPPSEPACARPAAGHPTCARPSGRAAFRDPPRRVPRSTNPRCLPSWAALLGDGDSPGKPVEASSIPGRLGDCPQVVPSLWRFRRRLFNPCRWDTF